MQIKIIKGFLEPYNRNHPILEENKIENKLRALGFTINGSNFAMCGVKNSVELSAMMVQLKKLGFDSIIVENMQQKFNKEK